MFATPARQSPTLFKSPTGQFTSPSFMSHGTVHQSERPLFENPSPTSTLTENATGGPIRLDGSRSTLGVNVNSSITPRRILIRSDPTMLTCFDPADKELYDLWAPKR
ncbi:hypothetical protein CVT26_005250 [Gymnopilus dilepis]|uniref:Uncharacterized protein n=1 Tax=Gymnopilus dilepis TaxID=231916 RepID=A0A409YVP8_9AGAR|nr:hypothetical protein CVT26_005250 [Gymnopilus dilepis]